jgi:hypothetical protein
MLLSGLQETAKKQAAIVALVGIDVLVLAHALSLLLQ